MCWLHNIGDLGSFQLLCHRLAHTDLISGHKIAVSAVTVVTPSQQPRGRNGNQITHFSFENMTPKLTYHANYNPQTRTYFQTTSAARKVRKGGLWPCNDVLSEKADYYAKKERINMKKQFVVSAISSHCDLNFQVLDSFVEMQEIS